VIEFQLFNAIFKSKTLSSLLNQYLERIARLVNFLSYYYLISYFA